MSVFAIFTFLPFAFFALTLGTFVWRHRPRPAPALTASQVVRMPSGQVALVDVNVVEFSP